MKSNQVLLQSVPVGQCFATLPTMFVVLQLAFDVALSSVGINDSGHFREAIVDVDLVSVGVKSVGREILEVEILQVF